MHPDLPPDLLIRKSLKAKRVTLRVNPKLRAVELVVPKRVSMKYAMEFAATQTEWIADQRAKMGDALPLQAGEARALKRDARKVLTALVNEKLKLLPNTKNVVPSTSTLPSWATLPLFEFMRPAAGETRWKDVKIRIGDPKTRWGSCHPDGRISFSWRLMLAPEAARDYVVAHEVAHLIHHDHGRKFWELCRQLSNDFDEGHGWMKREGNNLHSYVIQNA